MKRTVSTVGLGPSSHYTSLTTWEAGEQGNTQCDLRVAIVDDTVIQDPLARIDELAEYLLGPALFVTAAGQLLAYVDNGTVERLQSAVNEPATAVDLERLIDDFVEERFGIPPAEEHPEVRAIVRGAAKALALLITRDPSALERIEWRHLEEVLAEVFDGLGFTVELTPPAHDGGKDLILSCTVSTGAATYVVEVKHWVCGKPVGPDVVKKLYRVVVRGGRAAGLILATSGFTEGATDALLSVEHRLAGRTREDVFTLCRLYSSGRAGLLSPDALWDELMDGGIHTPDLDATGQGTDTLRPGR